MSPASATCRSKCAPPAKPAAAPALQRAARCVRWEQAQPRAEATSEVEPVATPAAKEEEPREGQVAMEAAVTLRISAAEDSDQASAAVARGPTERARAAAAARQVVPRSASVARARAVPSESARAAADRDSRSAAHRERSRRCRRTPPCSPAVTRAALLDLRYASAVLLPTFRYPPFPGARPSCRAGAPQIPCGDRCPSTASPSRSCKSIRGSQFWQENPEKGTQLFFVMPQNALPGASLRSAPATRDGADWAVTQTMGTQLFFVTAAARWQARPWRPVLSGVEPRPPGFDTGWNKGVGACSTPPACRSTGR